MKKFLKELPIIGSVLSYLYQTVLTWGAMRKWKRLNEQHYVCLELGSGPKSGKSRCEQPHLIGPY